MSKPLLEKLFDSAGKVRLLRFFIFNTDTELGARDLSHKLKMKSVSVRRELKQLVELGLVSERRKSGKKLYATVRHFAILDELRGIVMKSALISFDVLSRRIAKIGKVKMLVVGGIFLNAEKSRVDLFVVGDDLSQKRFQNLVGDLEAEIGHEISYALINTADFWYRYNMFDRFIRDVFEMPHEVLLKKIKF